MVAALIVSASFGNIAQAPAKAIVEELNVRAQMQFLAGDSLQGRGSGTQFERIAADYVGSQFMQFGLEPAGENGTDGKATYVQTASRVRNTFDGKPTVTIGDRVFEHGKDILAIRVNSGQIAGGLQKIDLEGKPNENSAVFVRIPADKAAGNIFQLVQGLNSAGASIVLVEETPSIRGNWTAFAERPLSFSSPAPGSRSAAVIVVSKDAASIIRGLSDGATILFSGKTSTQTQQSWNAVGKITGTDPMLGSEVILLSSHLDHLGVRPNAPGDDKIFNGADDDASGTIAVLELARALAKGPTRPKRTIYFVCFGSEEMGGIGATFFVNNLPFPKEKLVANLEFEMIGRPDAKVKAEELWLTGYERSDLGPELAKRGAKLVQDPHPEENFFQRSDNYTLARQGIIAHTVSSFGLHTDYHKATDEVGTIDFAHMTRAINSMVAPVQWLVNSDFKPRWVEGMKP